MRLRSLVPLVLLTFATAHPASSQNWKEQQKSALLEHMKLTRTADRDLRIASAGTLFEILRDGITASPSSDATMLVNRVQDGAIKQPSGIASFLVGKSKNREFKTGEKVYLSDIDMLDNGVRLKLVAADVTPVTEGGSTIQTRYGAQLLFPFRKNELQTKSADEILSAISSVLRIGADEPVAIDVGSSVAQVEQALGKPKTVVHAGEKTIYVYEALKVIFVEGKVAEVQ